MEETKCQICVAQKVYENSIALGIEPKDAFHFAVGYLLEGVVENAVDITYDEAYELGKEEGYLEGYEVGFDEGYNQASLDVAEIVVAYAKSANES